MKDHTKLIADIEEALLTAEEAVNALAASQDENSDEGNEQALEYLKEAIQAAQSHNDSLVP